MINREGKREWMKPHIREYSFVPDSRRGGRTGPPGSYFREDIMAAGVGAALLGASVETSPFHYAS